LSYSQDNDSSNWPIITYPFEYLDKLRRMGFKAIFHPSQMMNLLKLVCWLLRKCEEDLSANIHGPFVVTFIIQMIIGRLKD
jgi:hypothetical protein